MPLADAIRGARIYLQAILERHWEWAIPGGSRIKALANVPEPYRCSALCVPSLSSSPRPRRLHGRFSGGSGTGSGSNRASTGLCGCPEPGRTAGGLQGPAFPLYSLFDLDYETLNRSALDGLLERLGGGAELVAKKVAKTEAETPTPFHAELLAPKLAYLRLAEYSNAELPKIEETMSKFREAGAELSYPRPPGPPAQSGSHRDGSLSRPVRSA